MDIPGYSKPDHQYGTGWHGDVAAALGDADFTVLPDAEGVVRRELDATEIRELGIWEHDGFTARTPESTT